MTIPAYPAPVAGDNIPVIPPSFSTFNGERGKKFSDSAPLSGVVVFKVAIEPDLPSSRSIEAIAEVRKRIHGKILNQ